MPPQDETLARELAWLREFTPATRRAAEALPSLAGERVEWVLFSPLPGHLLIEDALSHQTSRDNFIASLIVR